MKRLFSAIIIAISLFQAYSSNWTFHGFKDNYSAVTWTDFGQSSITYLCMSWDWGWDQTGLGPIDSGTRTLINGPGGVVDSGFTGYADVLTLDVPDGFVFITCSVTSGYPDYNGNSDNVTFPSAPGEYWLDMDSAGQPRLSTTQPPDFGKWAWDGSINPSWTAAKKGFAKGHNKQPLPSPK